MKRVLVFLGLWLAIAAATPTYALSPALTGVILNSVDPDYKTAIAAMTIKPTGINLHAGNQFIRGLKNGGYWTTIAMLYGFCPALHDGQAFFINLKNPAVVGQAVNAPAFTINGGYTGDGATSYVDTSGILSTNSIVSASSLGIDIYERTNASTNTFAAGARSGSVNNTVSIKPRRTTNVMGGAAASSSIDGVSAVIADSRALSGINYNGTTWTLRRNGIDIENTVNTAGTVPVVSVWIGGENSSGSLVTARAAQEAGLVAHASWLSAQELGFYNLVQICMTAIGAAV